MSPVTDVQTRRLPQLLVVDDEPMLLEVVGDLVAPQVNCLVLRAKDLKEARAILAAEEIDVLLADVHLPDGDGISLIPELQKNRPAAMAIVITGDPSIDRAISAMRTGALDFVCKPFSATHLAERVKNALRRSELRVKDEKRLARMRQAVHRLNQSRKLVSKKVDLLCNDLISAYGELARQLDSVRTEEAFRKYLDAARDLEQTLCHTMDWILRQLGYCNVAVWLASENNEFHLGAYMKYTIPGEPAFAEAMRANLVPLVMRQGTVHLMPEELHDALSEAEMNFMPNQEILACSANYLGEPLAAIVLFRDGSKPFSQEDEATMRMIAPVFATAMASAVREGPATESASSDEAGGTKLEDDKEDKDGADWWKKGEQPPF